MTRSIALSTFTRRIVGAFLTLGLVTAPLPVLAAPPAEEGAAEAPEGTPAVAGGNVAILKFTGDDYQASIYRERVQASLQAQGYTANFIKRSIDEARDKNKCRTLDDACLEKIGAYLNKNSSTIYDFYVWAEVPATGAGSVVVYDVKGKKKIVDLDLSVSYNDIILVEVIGAAIARRVAESQVPPEPATEAEKEILATLDQPKETPEEIARREAELEKVADEAGSGVIPDAGEQTVDLKNEFQQLCRKGPREDREVEGDDGEVIKERDLRPPCKRGPVFGYWQPRAWVALTLTLGSAAGMGIMYGMAAAARSDWRAATDALEASGLSGSDPNNACEGGVCYADLAGEVSNASSQVRRRAIVGDVLLGSTVLLAGVLAIIIYQDRQAAKNFLKEEKEMRAVSNLRVGPVFGPTNGAAMSFEF